MANKFNFKILTPNGVAYSGMINNFDTTTEKGRIGIYANMTKMVCLLKPNLSTINEDDNKKFDFLITNGLMYVEPKEVKVFSDLCVLKSDIKIDDLKKEINNLNDLINKTTKETLKINYEIQKQQKEILLDIFSKS